AAMKSGDAIDVSLLFDAAIFDLDVHVGRLLDEIKNLKLDLNTMIIVTSDHGQEFGEHDCHGCHGHSVYDEILRVPMIVKIPGAPGRDLASPVSTMDIVPTVLRALGLPASPAIDGSALPLVDPSESIERAFVATSPGKDETSPVEEDLLAKIDKGDVTFGLLKPSVASGFHPIRTFQTGLRSVRSGQYKLVVDHFSGRLRLYDLKKDPGETKDVAEALPAVASHLKTKLILGK
ncbi:MAG: sulfatase-like hydrolase/transferase, partial [Bdellovibrionota bacterium]